jgi:hypothetical protein
MKRLILLFLLFASTSNAAITRVQTATGNTGTSTTSSTFTVTLGSPTTAGNVLIIGFAVHIPGTFVLTGTALAGNPILETTVGYNSNGPQIVHLAFVRCLNSGSTIIFTSSAGTTNFVGAAVVAEYSGTNIISESTPGTTLGGATTLTSGTFTTIAPVTLCMAAFSQRFTTATEQTAFASAATNSFTIVGQTSSNVNTTNTDRGLVLLERITLSTISATAGVTSSFSNNWTSTGLAFKEVEAAAGTVGYTYGQ